MFHVKKSGLDMARRQAEKSGAAESPERLAELARLKRSAKGIVRVLTSVSSELPTRRLAAHLADNVVDFRSLHSLALVVNNELKGRLYSKRAVSLSRRLIEHKESVGAHADAYDLPGEGGDAPRKTPPGHSELYIGSHIATEKQECGPCTGSGFINGAMCTTCFGAGNTELDPEVAELLRSLGAGFEPGIESTPGREPSEAPSRAPKNGRGGDPLAALGPLMRVDAPKAKTGRRLLTLTVEEKTAASIIRDSKRRDVGCAIVADLRAWVESLPFYLSDRNLKALFVANPLREKSLYLSEKASRRFAELRALSPADVKALVPPPRCKAGHLVIDENNAGSEKRPLCRACARARWEANAPKVRAGLSRYNAYVLETEKECFPNAEEPPPVEQPLRAIVRRKRKINGRHLQISELLECGHWLNQVSFKATRGKRYRVCPHCFQDQGVPDTQKVGYREP